MRTPWQVGIPGTWVPMVHRTCPHNEVGALCSRVLAPLPPEVFGSFGAGPSWAFRRLRSLARRFPGHKWSNLETAQTYEGSMRRKYLEAAASLRDERISWKDALLSCFLKAEKVNPLAKFPKPRMIFPRSARYNLEVASRLKPFEHWLWGYLTGSRLWGGDNTRVVAKGLSPRRRANLIVRKFNSFRQCVVFEVDGKAFEAHVGPEHLKAEHEVYARAFPRDKGLLRLLREQLRLQGKLPCGAKFSRPGGRASGDFNTGMGNTLLMLAIVVGVLRTFGVRFDVLVDGDNALVFLEREASRGVVRDFAARVLLESGHEFELERPVHTVEEVRFGRSAPVSLGGARGYTMVREYLAVISGGLSSHRYLREPRYAVEWLTGVAMCELSMARGVPVLQAWASSVLKALDYRGRVRTDPYRDYFAQGAYLAGLDEVQVVSEEARVSFERAFGLCPESQVALERSFTGPKLGGYEYVDCRDLADLPPRVTNPWMDGLPLSVRGSVLVS